MYPYVCKFRDFLLKYLEIQKEKFSKNRQIKSESVIPVLWEKNQGSSATVQTSFHT